MSRRQILRPQITLVHRTKDGRLFVDHYGAVTISRLFAKKEMIKLTTEQIILVMNELAPPVQRNPHMGTHMGTHMEIEI